ncbi:protein SERAC1 [Marchantia polymorpha subsp. ruderalis]|uniref:GPI inositol-deacylase n=2 Tax=Marchantia polymorpha TaxID=3197 RepID=A0AAF6AQH4_MARPO|nr:hypothetical protein MARPO_0033s0109 [Marchantia polymorpha]BBM98694.1 hypothetical protein Mp_1g15520 [Marchantia polymorpha subsp. ruderalis]|eukprot:PTQ41713.1 hypothetical protein MARPO_0033s0109 [Marchantia polymorpha]
MLVRTQVRRQLRIKYGVVGRQSSRISPAAEPQSSARQRPCVENERCGGISCLQLLACRPTKLGPERDFASLRKYFSSPCNRSSKSASPEPPPENAHPQVNGENLSKEFTSGSPFSTHHLEQERLVVNVGNNDIRSSSWTKRNNAIGAISASVVVLVSAVAAMSYEEEGSTTQAKGVLVSTGSIIWDSVAHMKKAVGTMLREGAESVIDAGTSTATLAYCLISVLMTASEGTINSNRSWLKPRVAALVADIAAHEYRRKAVVEAGGGQVVDWLLKAVATVDAHGCLVSQAESARALAYLLSDESTCEDVLSRPRALSLLFQFASSLHAEQGFQDWSKGQALHIASEGSRGRSMLVTAIMDLITSSCDAEVASVRPKLPESADPEDIAAALQVVKDGGWHGDDQNSKDSDSPGKTGNNRKGVHGIGIRVLGGTGVLGVQREQYSLSLSEKFYSSLMEKLKEFWIPRTLLFTSNGNSSTAFSDKSQRRSWGGQKVAASERSRAKYGLWDDLQGRHITVPLAAWALANWAQASAGNRAKILELDGDGEALLAAVLAPEKTVKWHGAMAMRLLLGSKNYALNDIAPRWSSALLGVAAQAGKVEDTSLAHCAILALTACVSRSKPAQSLVFQTGLPVLREIANESEVNSTVQGALAQLLDVLTAEEDGLPLDESKKWAATLLRWACNRVSDNSTRDCGSRVLVRVLNNLGQGGIPISQAWLALLLVEAVADGKLGHVKTKRHGHASSEAKEREQVQNQLTQAAIAAAAQLGKVIAQEAAYRSSVSGAEGDVAESAAELPMIDLLGLDVMGSSTTKAAPKESTAKVSAKEAAEAVRKAIKSLTELTAEEPAWRQRILDAGALCLLRRFLLCNDYEDWSDSEAIENASQIVQNAKDDTQVVKKGSKNVSVDQNITPHIRKHAARLLSVLTLQPAASPVITGDREWFTWLRSCADGRISGCTDKKTRSYALTALLNVSQAQVYLKNPRPPIFNAVTKGKSKTGKDSLDEFWPRYEDTIFLMNPSSDIWKRKLVCNFQIPQGDEQETKTMERLDEVSPANQGVSHSVHQGDAIREPVMDVVFVHGLRGGPYKTWRVSENKVSSTTPLVEKIDDEAGKQGTCWPQEWLADDLPRSRLLTIKYKTNLSEWSGATLPLQEVSSMLLDKLLAAGVGDRPLVFVTHSMGGLVVKQMLLQAGRDKSRAHLVNQTTGIVFYSCPHFGSKLADMPWRIGLVLRPAPTIGELRSGSPRLEELNHYLRHLHKDGHLDVLSFSETKVTPLVEGYGGWGLRMEVVPIESAYPGFGELVVLPGTDHVNSCKPLNRADPAYTKTLEFLHNQELYAERVSQASID